MNDRALSVADLHVPFDMTPLVTLRQMLTHTAFPVSPAIIAAIGEIATHHAHVDFHVSSQIMASAYLTYPVATGGLRYGTISHALPPPATIAPATLHREFRRLAAECLDLLQFLELVQWQRWQRRQDADQRREPLTARERDILLHCFAGQARQTTAERLHLAPTTVKKHLRNLYAKLGVHSMQEALAVGRAAGLFLHLL